MGGLGKGAGRREFLELRVEFRRQRFDGLNFFGLARFHVVPVGGRFFPSDSKFSAMARGTRSLFP